MTEINFDSLIEYLDERFSFIDERFDRVENRMDSIETTIANFAGEFRDFRDEFTILVHRTDRMENWAEPAGNKLGLPFKR